MSEIFVNLHAHSYYSIGDSVTSPEDMVKKTKELGMSSMAISDHGTLAGHFQFREACKKHGIKPIFGIEAYFMEDVGIIERSNNRILAIQEENRTLKNNKEGKKRLEELILETKEEKKATTKYNHLILLAKNYQGYQNLIKIHNAGVLDGFYGKPRVDWSVLERYKGGLIASSACLGGVICKDIESQQIEKAKLDIARFKQIFGEDNFYLELQLHDIKLQVAANKALLQLAEITNTPFNIAVDSHYNEPQDAYTRNLIYKLSKKTKDKKPDVLTEKTIIEENTSTVEDESSEEASADDTGDYNDGVLTDLYLKNTNMLKTSWEKYMSDVPLSYLKKAIETTKAIENKISNFEFDCSIKFPIFDTEDLNQEEFLSKMAWAGLVKKSLHTNPVYVERLKRELNTVTKLGFASYFNVVGDMICHAKKFQSVGIGRGSAASSLLSYVTGITELDPIKYELYFERFLDETKGVIPPTFGVADITNVSINYSEILSDCACNQKH